LPCLFRGFLRRFCGGFLSHDLLRLLLLVTPGFLAAAVLLALAFFQAEPKDAALVTAAALAASPVFQKLRERWTRQP
jgi:hypothetical protein